jgi:hypothetical protein
VTHYGFPYVFLVLRHGAFRRKLTQKKSESS